MSTDTKNVLFNGILSSISLPSPHLAAEFTEAGHQINLDQHINSGGKKKGRVQVANTAGVYAMAVAVGGAPESDWNINSVAVTPAYTGAYPAPTVFANSDTKPNLNNTTHEDCDIASVPFPIILAADLADLGHVVNYREYSGKKAGGVVLVDTAGVLSYAVATGGLPASPWNLAVGTVVTPIGTLRPSTVVNGNEQKPVVAHAEYLTSVDFPVVLIADLADLTYTPLYNTEQTVGSHNNKQVIANDAGVLRLMYATYAAGVLTWHDLGAGILSFPVV